MPRRRGPIFSLSSNLYQSVENESLPFGPQSLTFDSSFIQSMEQVWIRTSADNFHTSFLLECGDDLMLNNLKAEEPLARRDARTSELQSTKPIIFETEIVHTDFLEYEVRIPKLREFENASIWGDLMYDYIKNDEIDVFLSQPTKRRETQRQSVSVIGVFCLHMTSIRAWWENMTTKAPRDLLRSRRDSRAGWHLKQQPKRLSVGYIARKGP